MCEDEYLDGELCKGEIEKCICKLKNNKTGGSDGLVGELLKYGLFGTAVLVFMIAMIHRNILYCSPCIPTIHSHFCTFCITVGETG